MVPYGKNLEAGRTVTLDGEEEYFNKESVSGDGSGYAFAKFSYDIPKDYEITKATLIGGGTSLKGYEFAIYCLDKNATDELPTLFNLKNGEEYRYNEQRLLVNSNAADLAENETGRTEDVTDIIRGLSKQRASKATFQWTGN